MKSAFIIRLSIQFAAIVALSFMLTSCMDHTRTVFGGAAQISFPITFEYRGEPFVKRNQVRDIRYIGTWGQDVPNPVGWSLLIPMPPGENPQPGEIRVTKNGSQYICGNEANDKLHPMHKFMFSFSSSIGLLVRNATPKDFSCAKSYQEIWDYLVDVDGLKPGETILHSYCMLDYGSDLTRNGFQPKGPFECRLILKRYKVEGEEKVDIAATIKTETDRSQPVVDSDHLNITLTGGVVQDPK